MAQQRLLFVAIPLLFACVGARAGAEDVLWHPQARIDLNEPLKTRPFEISVTSADSLARGWQAGARLHVRAYVERSDGSAAWVRDLRGRRSWRLVLNDKREGRRLIFPAPNAYSGRLKVLVNNRDWENDRGAGYSIEKVLSYRFPDGAAIRVFYADQTLERYGVSPDFARQAVDAAVQGYQTITQFQGFQTPGFSFVDPSPDYAQDPDRAIDVYIGDPAGESIFRERGFNARYFKDAPCFDAVDRGEGRFDAVILLPANYADFIRSWEKINPSPLGRRNIEVDLRGTLAHEMLHVILFYYNRNLGKGTGGESAGARELDWYVEGLARYFETFVGARHDFFSQGFKQTLPDKIRFSRGGSNYFMRYPDQAFTGLRYENAIFWRYLDYRFGMGAIEKLSRVLRGGGDLPGRLEEATGMRFDELLDEFAVSILFKDFGLKDEAGYLNDVARTRLLFRGGQFELIDGFGATRPLGKTCRTDWVGVWGEARAALGEPSAAGDSTPESEVSAWATDYYEILPDAGRPEWPVLRVAQPEKPVRLSIQVILLTQGGSEIRRSYSSSGRRGETIDLPDAARREGLGPSDIQVVHLLVTNHDRAQTARYEIISA